MVRIFHIISFLFFSLPAAHIGVFSGQLENHQGQRSKRNPDERIRGHGRQHL